MVFNPRGISMEAVEVATERVHKRMSRYPMMVRRALKTLWNTRSFITALHALMLSISYRKVIDKVY
jgi:hypothetical protein